MRLTQEEYYSDNLTTSTWLGEVVVNEDPQYEGRIKVKVYGKFDNLSNEHIPWAYPANNTTAGSITGGGYYSVPRVGSIVSIKFDNGNIYHPEYFFHQRISDELKEEIKTDPINFHSLIFDTDEALKIYFTQGKGLSIDYKETIINLDPDNNFHITNPNGDLFEILADGTVNLEVAADINVKCVNIVGECSGDATLTVSGTAEVEATKIKLGAAAAEALVQGTSFKPIFDGHCHIGNLGSPTGTPISMGFETPLSTKSFTE